MRNESNEFTNTKTIKLMSSNTGLKIIYSFYIFCKLEKQRRQHKYEKLTCLQLTVC